jgi:hypothetical protein
MSAAIFMAVVVACGFALMMTAYRSVLLAVKAALLNLVSICAAYGVVVAVFQWGWGRSLLGVGEKVPIESYVPLFMFAIIFGLSMDYEIFLVSRVKEHWDRSGDAKGAVEAGLAAVGRVVASAASIMGSVFASFVGSTSVEVKMIAVGLAAAVVLDAFVVRMVLVPSIHESPRASGMAASEVARLEAAPCRRGPTSRDDLGRGVRRDDPTLNPVDRGVSAGRSETRSTPRAADSASVHVPGPPTTPREELDGLSRLA